MRVNDKKSKEEVSERSTSLRGNNSSVSVRALPSISLSFFLVIAGGGHQDVAQVKG